jgi:hypothetical protein
VSTFLSPDDELTEATMMTHAPSPSQHSPWLVGKDKEGRWVVRDPSGLHGGVFADRTAALHFALLENGRHAAIMLPGSLELDMALRPTSVPRPLKAQKTSS